MIRPPETVNAQVPPLAHCMPPVHGDVGVGERRHDRCYDVAVRADHGPGDGDKLTQGPVGIGALCEAILLLDTETLRLRKGRHRLHAAEVRARHHPSRVGSEHVSETLRLDPPRLGQRTIPIGLRPALA